jgi:hypothetical protein
MTEKNKPSNLELFRAERSRPRPWLDKPEPKSRVWLNIGYHKPDGEYVRLPFGVYMDPAEIARSSHMWSDDQKALLKVFMDQANALEEGTSTEIADFNGSPLLAQIRKTLPY